MVNHKKTVSKSKKTNKKPKCTNAERISLYKTNVNFSILAVLFVIGYVVYCFMHRDEFKDEPNVNISIFVAMAIAVLLIANVIRLYLRNKRIDREIQDNKSDAVNFLKESHEYYKNYTPIISHKKSVSLNQDTSHSENVYCSEKEIQAESFFNETADTVKQCEINDEELMRKYEEECINWKIEREQKKLDKKEKINKLFSLICKHFLKITIIIFIILLICKIYFHLSGVSFININFIKNFSAGIIKIIPFLGAYVVLFFLLGNKQRVDKSAVIYNELIPQMVKVHFGSEATFTQQSGFDCSEIYSNNSFKYHCYKTESAYFIDGTYRNINFQLSYEKILWGRVEETEDGEKVIPEPLFNGFLICIEIPRQVESHLGIYSHRISELNDILENSIETTTENMNFSRLFEIKCENEENIYYILTPDLMERITSLHPDMSKAYDELHIYWHENKMYVGISAKSSRMNIHDMKNGKEGYMQIKKQIEAELKRAENALETVMKLL